MRSKKKKKQKLVQEDLVTKHSAVLGLCAFVNAFPYDVPEFVPDILMVLSDHLHDPQPIPVCCTMCLITRYYRRKEAPFVSFYVSNTFPFSIQRPEYFMRLNGVWTKMNSSVVTGDYFWTVSFMIKNHGLLFVRVEYLWWIISSRFLRSIKSTPGLVKHHEFYYAPAFLSNQGSFCKLIK